MFHLKKEFTKSNLVLYLSFILVTWSLLQVSLTDFFENNDNILIKIPSIYAQDDDGGNGNGGKAVNGNGNSDSGDSNGEVSDDNGDSDLEELSQEEDTQDVGQEVGLEELTLSEAARSEILTLIQQDADDVFEELTLEDSQDEDVDVSRFGGGGPSGTSITLQLPPGDQLQLSLPVSLPLPPAGPLPPGGLPPIPGSPLPPGSPIPPGGGPTPPKDLPPLLGDLPSHVGQYDDDDDEKEEDDKDDKDDKDNN
ncbi:MAG TPA: hypothetical protein VLA74_01215 [Nitrososphaeraceae archaeon]|nr:hypothetical protein [Nitrososphaeraceae archaeon]